MLVWGLYGEPLKWHVSLPALPALSVTVKPSKTLPSELLIVWVNFVIVV
jgi:hypothetical protein